VLAIENGFNSPQKKSEELKPMMDILDVAEKMPYSTERKVTFNET
jgi:hypothetical protein